MLYELYELNHAAIKPARAAADMGRIFWQTPINPLARTQIARNCLARLHLFERVTRRYERPEFGITTTKVDGREVCIEEECIWQAPFCNLLHFRKQSDHVVPEQPPLLIVTPMSGHYSTLLRGTVEVMLPDHDVYVTDWVDARQVPVVFGDFDLDTYIDYLVEIFGFMGPELHVMAVCQPSIPVLAAISLISADRPDNVPASMTLMGGPIDTRKNPTDVNKVAVAKGVNWFRRNVIAKVPLPYSGFMRRVYPGFLQLTGFMSMNMDRHIRAHKELFLHLVEGDGDSAQKHMDFYDEYMSVMDLTAEFYLQTVETVFVEHLLPRGLMKHRDRHVDLSAIRKTALLTVEGENDDISGVGQTRAAHDLCLNIPDENKMHYVQNGVGHYGVFNGRRFQNEIAPVIRRFIQNSSSRFGYKPFNAVSGLNDNRQVEIKSIKEAMQGKSQKNVPNKKVETRSPPCIKQEKI